MTDQNKSQESEQKKWSPTPWSVSLIRTNWIFDSRQQLVAELESYSGAEQSAANAARIVECANFCEGLASIELQQSGCDLLNRMASELEQLKAERDELKKSIDLIHDLDGKTMNGMQEEINNLKAERDRLETLKAELQSKL